MRRNGLLGLDPLNVSEKSKLDGGRGVEVKMLIEQTKRRRREMKPQL